LPEEEFPPLARFEDAKIFTIAQKDLKDGLKKTSYALECRRNRQPDSRSGPSKSNAQGRSFAISADLLWRK
jgi:DNA polymerase III sliding clamp (beta) subunit (PCNA family)